MEAVDEPGLLLLEHFNVSKWMGRVLAKGPLFHVILLPYAHPLGYTLSWAFFRSPKTQMALSARQREHGLLPSHLGPGQFWLSFFLSPCLCHCYIPWISLNDSDRKLCIRACGHYLNASGRTMVLIVGQPWLCVYVCMWRRRKGVDESKIRGGIKRKEV